MKMHKYFILFLLLLLPRIVFAQQASEVTLTVNEKFDIRNVAELYFGDADLWPYILKYNNKASLSAVKLGDQIKIPVKKVESMLQAVKRARSTYADAVNIGAKVLANDLLDDAGKLLEDANGFRNNLNYDSAEKAASESVKLSEKAYRKTKEIREKTIDAIISFKKGTIQKMYPSNMNWQNAEIYDNLRENDWARTLALSLANITFQDLSQIKLNENSQAMIQHSRYDPIDKKTDTKVKIEKGDAYAMLQSSPKKNFDLDIKGVKTVINSKYFWIEKNNKSAKFANYNGEIKLAVKDSAVTVKKNQGSLIPEGGYPTKPKNLLAAPALTAPADLVNLSNPNVTFSWSKIPSAGGYWLIIASDSRFKNLYGVYKNIEKESFSVSNIQPGVYYWYVCSVDSSGLPGPYSVSRGFVYSDNKNKPFLIIDSLPDNNAVKEVKLLITGKTDPGCIVKINDTLQANAPEGKFSALINLKEGRNRVKINSVNSLGLASVIEKNVFLESDPDIKILWGNYGIIKDNAELPVTGNAVNLNLIIRPYASLEVKSFTGRFGRTVYCDSSGNCSLSVPLLESREEFSLYVKTNAGYERNGKVTFVRDAKPLAVILTSPIYGSTNKEKVVLSGNAPGAKLLTINDIVVQTGIDGYFSFETKLAGFENKFLIKAVDRAGKTVELEKKIIFDNTPPKLISKEINWADNNNSALKIIVAAEDQTELKRTAEIEFLQGNELRKEIIVYNQKNKVYEGTIFVPGRKLPLIKSITLGDYLLNQKTYSF